MTYIDVMEAIADKIVKLWPDRMLYRDFCPVDFQRPSGFLYVQEAEYTDAALGLVRWKMQAELMLFSETSEYSIENTEQLRRDQLRVLSAFGGSGLAVEDRHITVHVTADAPGPGEAYVTFKSDWFDSRPGYQDPEEAAAPRMENYELNVVDTGR